MTKDKIGHKREFFRMDAVVPFKITVVPPDKRGDLQPKLSNATDLKPGLVNISGGGMSFKAAKAFNKGDILEIILSLPLVSASAICFYGEVLRSGRTINNLHQVFVKFTVINEQFREMIVSFVFQLEREILRNTQSHQNVRFDTVPVHKFVEGTVLPFDVFTNEKDTIKFLFETGLPFDGITQEFFLEKGITNVYVKQEDMPLLDDYLSKHRVKKKVFDKEDILSFKEYSFNKKIYHSIGKDVLVPRSEITFSLFAMKDFIYSPFIEATTVKPVTVDEKISSGPENILIKKSEIPVFRAYLKGLASHIKATSHLKAMVLREEAKLIVDELLDAPDNSAKAAEATATAGRLADCMIENKDYVYTLMSPNSGDFYTAVHSVNVTATSIRAGMALNLKRDALWKLGTGALLHDIGHSLINDETIDKQGKLSSYEYEALKTHVIEGVKILKKYDDIPAESVNAVLHHHEKINGKGYPSRLAGKEISLFGMVLSIADSYDLLTTVRPYRNAMPSFEALSTLARESRNYEPEILKLFIRIFSRVTTKS